MTNTNARCRWGLSLLLVAGCGRGLPATAPVEGQVVYRGQPVPNARVDFWPETGRSATGTTDADGNYKLTTFKQHDGALPGRHQVSIFAAEAVGGFSSFEDEVARGFGGEKLKPLVPAKYRDRQTSGLTAEVQAGPNRIDFNLQ